jgi:hypothetical protein
MIQAADIETMSLEERLQAMEMLWASLLRTPETVPSPHWHEEVVAARLSKIERVEGRFLTITELKARLREPRP